MRSYQLHAVQTLPTSKAMAWGFLKNPRNLKEITPRYMGFEILSGCDRPMFPGQIIQYKINLFPGISTKWITEITHIVEGNYFVDEQRFGPYALWHHKHFLKEVKGGVQMEDLIDFKLPFGILGQLAHTFFIKKQLKKIFNYREQKLSELFGHAEGISGFLKIKSI